MMRSVFSWLFILILLGANFVTMFILWGLLNDTWQPPGLVSSEATDLLPLPVATPPRQPTSLPTQVAIFQPTSTVTPIPLPSATPIPLPTSTIAPPPRTIPVAVPVEPVASTPPETQHVVIISIDGLRPDALFLAHTPTLNSLIERGAYSPNAQTVSLSITLPSHASMLSGMLPAKHGIEWGLPYIGWPGMNGPTLFNVAHDAGLKTGMVFGKDKLNYLALPGSVDQIFGADAHDPEIKDRAIEMIVTDMPHVLFIHFPDTDRVGHTYGWMSENQMQSITFVDGLIGEIIAALELKGYLNNTLLIVTADHGGHGKGHGDDSPEDRTIPWLVAGPQVRQGVMLTTSINTYDTAATALHVLNLPIPEIWDGRPVLEAFHPPQ